MVFREANLASPFPVIEDTNGSFRHYLLGVVRFINRPLTYPFCFPRVYGPICIVDSEIYTVQIVAVAFIASLYNYPRKLITLFPTMSVGDGATNPTLYCQRPFCSGELYADPSRYHLVVVINCCACALANVYLPHATTMKTYTTIRYRSLGARCT